VKLLRLHRPAREARRPHTCGKNSQLASDVETITSLVAAHRLREHATIRLNRCLEGEITT
jgi:hypothetical protein